MADEITNIADIIEPKLFLPYMIQRSTALNAFVQAGIIEPSAEFDALVTGGGTLIDMPFWQSLSGEDQIIKSTGSLESKKIGTGRDVAIKQMRADMWSNHDLARVISGSDPAAAIGEMLGQYWAEKTHNTALAFLRGIFGAASMSSNVLHIHHTAGGAGSAVTANKFNGSTFIDAQQCLGDHKKFLTAICIHSQVESALRKQDLIDDIPDSQGQATIPTFQGLRVVIDDGMPTETIDGDTVYTTYLFARGAIALGFDRDNPPVEGGTGTFQLEWERNGRSHVTSLINRRRFLMHLRGVKWTGNTMVDQAPTNAELAIAANWERVYDPKNVRVVQFKHNI